MQRFAPHAVVFSGVGFFACIGYFTYLAHVSPTHPDQIAGLTARMDDHGYYFFVSPWQGWLLNVGPFACIGACFVVLGIGHHLGWDMTAAVVPRGLKWLFFTALGACVASLFWPLH